MYYIITSSKEIYDFAKRKGAKVLSINQPVVIETGELSKVIDVESDIVDEFLSNFPNIDMTSLGARCLKYILANNMEVKGDLRDTVYPKVAEYFETTVQKIIVTREWVKKELTELGFTFPDSKANFIFASHKSVPAEEIFKALRAQDIYVRYWNKPRINNSLRITIGTDEEMNRFVEFLKSFLSV